jgi:hypothetical protein
MILLYELVSPRFPTNCAKKKKNERKKALFAAQRRMKSVPLTLARAVGLTFIICSNYLVYRWFLRFF